MSRERIQPRPLPINSQSLFVPLEMMFYAKIFKRGVLQACILCRYHAIEYILTIINNRTIKTPRGNERGNEEEKHRVTPNCTCINANEWS